MDRLRRRGRPLGCTELGGRTLSVRVATPPLVCEDRTTVRPPGATEDVSVSCCLHRDRSVDTKESRVSEFQRFCTF